MIPWSTAEIPQALLRPVSRELTDSPPAFHFCFRQWGNSRCPRQRWLGFCRGTRLLSADTAVTHETATDERQRVVQSAAAPASPSRCDNHTDRQAETCTALPYLTQTPALPLSSPTHTHDRPLKKSLQAAGWFNRQSLPPPRGRAGMRTKEPSLDCHCLPR